MRINCYKAKSIARREWVFGKAHIEHNGDHYLVKRAALIYKGWRDTYTNLSVQAIQVDPVTVSVATNAKLCKDQLVYEGTIAFDEIEYDDRDDRIYFRCTWIKELNTFAWLNSSEWNEYQTDPIYFIEGVYDRSFNLEGSEKMHYVGHYCDEEAREHFEKGG